MPLEEQPLRIQRPVHYLAGRAVRLLQAALLYSVDLDLKLKLHKLLLHSVVLQVVHLVEPVLVV
jgi:hypothetical protein